MVNTSKKKEARIRDEWGGLWLCELKEGRKEANLSHGFCVKQDVQSTNKRSCIILLYHYLK